MKVLLQCLLSSTTKSLHVFNHQTFSEGLECPEGSLLIFTDNSIKPQKQVINNLDNCFETV